MDPCVFCFYLAYCMERENLQYESVYFKELHKDQEYYRPTIYTERGAAVVSTITRVYTPKLLGCLLGISPSGRNPFVRGQKLAINCNLPVKITLGFHTGTG